MATSKRAPFRPPTEQEVAEAYRHGEESLRSEPHATTIHFDPTVRRFTLTLINGTAISFGADALPELQGASDGQLAQASVTGYGSTLEWAELDMHVSVEGLVIDLFGGRPWQKALRAELSRRLARSGSEARTKASQENGKKGGRPRKRSA